MRRAGFTTKEVVLALIVLLIASSIVILLALRVRSRNQTGRDVERMQHVYLSLAMYETDSNGWLPPNLSVARSYIPDDIALLSTNDPYAETPTGESGFPVDGGLPDWNRSSGVRISYAYLYAFAEAGKAKPKPWYEQKYDPSVGLIADEWLGAVQATGSFGAKVSGKLYRLNTDGALHVIERGGSKSLGDVQDLFYRQ